MSGRIVSETVSQIKKWSALCSTISLFFAVLKAEVMAERLLCCLRWRYSAFDRNSGRERLLESPEVQLDTTRMGKWLTFVVTDFTRQTLLPLARCVVGRNGVSFNWRYD